MYGEYEIIYISSTWPMAFLDSDIKKNSVKTKCLWQEFRILVQAPINKKKKIKKQTLYSF